MGGARPSAGDVGGEHGKGLAAGEVIEYGEEQPRGCDRPGNSDDRGAAAQSKVYQPMEAATVAGFAVLEPMPGIEPGTSFLPRMCSTD